MLFFWGEGWSPWHVENDWNPRPGIWVGIWKFDVMFTPFSRWNRYQFVDNYGSIYLTLGPFEFNYLNREKA